MFYHIFHTSMIASNVCRQRKFFRIFEATAPAGLKQHKIYDDLCNPYKLNPSKKLTDSALEVVSS